jgi:hypothetical protein
MRQPSSLAKQLYPLRLFGNLSFDNCKSRDSELTGPRHIRFSRELAVSCYSDLRRIGIPARDIPSIKP